MSRLLVTYGMYNYGFELTVKIFGQTEVYSVFPWVLLGEVGGSKYTAGASSLPLSLFLDTVKNGRYVTVHSKESCLISVPSRNGQTVDI